MLRAIRVERTELSLGAAARLLGWSMTTMWRTENGHRPTTSEDVATIVTAYGLPVRDRAALVAAARGDDPSCIWDPPLPGIAPDAGAYASHLNKANSLTEWSETLIPRLLQTEGYALALLRSQGISADEAWRQWQARKQRQAVLGSLDYTAFLSEAALHRLVGGPDVHRDQLTHLLSLRDRGIGLRIVPTPPPAGIVSHPWLHLTFPSAPPLVTTTLLNGNFYIHDELVKPYQRQIVILNHVALPTPAGLDKTQQILEFRAAGSPRGREGDRSRVVRSARNGTKP